MRINRRHALGTFAGIAAAAATARAQRPRDVPADPTPEPRSAAPLILFAKPVQQLSAAQLAEFLRENDFAGIEATVRRGGQVEPQHVGDELPRLMEKLFEAGRTVHLLATDINSADSDHAREVLEAAAASGVRQFRMAYYRYELDQPVLPQLQRFTRSIESLVPLCRELNVQALYQNHAGSRYMGAALWDLQQVLADQPQEQIAVAFDIRHAVAEAPFGWQVAWNLVRPRTGAIFLKDMVRQSDGSLKNVPLGEGDVPQDYYQQLRAALPTSRWPVSLHMEYFDEFDPRLAADRLDAITNDRRAIRRLVGI